jgi:hypothetical protein
VKTLGSPAAVAVCALLLAVVVALSGGGRVGQEGVAAAAFAALLLAVALGLRGAADRGAALAALGVVVTVAAVGYDVLGGHGGRLALRPGEGAQAFEEESAAGEGLGLRPLGTVVSLDAVVGDEASLVVEGGGTRRRERLAPGRAVAVGAYRLGWGRLEPRARLTLALSKGGQSTAMDLGPGELQSFEGLDVEIERYFPDFALDDANNPFSRTDEPRNPAALLRVARDGRSWRVFVLQAMPGVHNVPDLPWTFALRGVTPDPRLTIAVHQEPAAPLAAAGVALTAAGLLLRRRA